MEKSGVAIDMNRLMSDPRPTWFHFFTKRQVDKAGLSLKSKIFTSFSNLG